MKKIVGVLIVLGFLFISNKTLAVLLIPLPLFISGPDGSYSYSCGGRIYNSQNDNGYRQCQQREKIKTEQEKIEKERLETKIKQERYNERKEEIVFYSDFFKETGVNLTLDTSEEQYSQWLKELKQAEVDYIKEQENQQKIKELEERINILESKPVIIEKIITPTEIINTHNKEEVAKPIVNENKSVKPVIKKEETKKEIIEEKPSTIIETTTTKETPIVPTDKSFFQRVFSWFKSLL